MNLESVKARLKEALKGRVVNGVLTNVITESELEELFKGLTPQSNSGIVDGGGTNETIQRSNGTSED